MSAPTRGGRPGTSDVLVLAGVVAVALNLRTAITVVGPLIPSIRADLGASNVALGLVGTLPVLAFGLVSPIAPAIGRRIGTGRALAGSLILLAAAIALRSAGGLVWLLAGTALLGVAIAIGNVLLPSLIKGRFSARASQVTTAYTALMVLAATVSAGIAVPLAQARSWEWSAGIWALPAAVGALVVIASLVIEGRLVPDDAAAAPPPGPTTPTGAMYRDRLAWQVTAFMGFQSTLFYVTIAWLPDMLIAKGMSEVQAGAMVSVLNIAGLIGVLATPVLHAGRPDQRRSTAVATAFAVVGAALLLVPGTALAPVASAVLGLGLGGTIGLALSFFALRTTNATDAASLSGMAQTWGYLLSAVGPVLWGALRDATGSWTLPTVLLVVVAAMTAVAGWAASADREVVPPAAVGQ